SGAEARRPGLGRFRPGRRCDLLPHARRPTHLMLPDELEVLVVESDPLEAELLSRSLGGLAETDRIGVARDGEEALDYLLGRNAYRHRLGLPPPAVVLLALRLPRVDGVEVLRTLRASPRTAMVPVVML